ncbi:MAG: hypothetical protein ABEJ56_04945 [Candidatus Nanohaloarchaea archaeon]
MGWYAVEEIEESLDDTRDLLLPFDRSTWLRLAAIIFFVGGSSSFYLPPDLAGFGQGFQQQDISGLESTPATGGFSHFSGFEMNSVLIAVLLIALGIGLLYSYLSAVFEFIFYRSLQDREVQIRKNFSMYRQEGLKLFIFRILFLAAIILSAISLVFSFSVDLLLGSLVTLFLVPFWIGLWLLSFTVRNLALPGVVGKDEKFFSSLKEATITVRKQWKQAGFFLLMKIVLGIVASIISGIGMMLGLIVIGIPLAILGVLLAFVNPLLVLIPVLIGLIGLATIALLVSIPVKSFLYLYVLRVFSRLDG